MTNVAYTTLTKVERRANHGVTLEVIKGVKKGVKLKLIVSLHPVLIAYQLQRFDILQHLQTEIYILTYDWIGPSHHNLRHNSDKREKSFS